MHEEKDEDVVHIRKRAEPKDCDTDCMDYSGWTESGVMECGIDDGDPEDILERRSLVKGDRKNSMCVATPLHGNTTAKPSSVCKGINVYDKLAGVGIEISSPTWPKVSKLEVRQ